MLLNFDSSASKSIAIPPTCRQITFLNSSADTCYWGWESNTAASGGAQGIPVAQNKGMVLDGAPKIARNLFFATAGTGTVNYTLLT